MPAQPSAECLALGYDGECDGNTATWCDNGTIYTIDCTSRGQGCGVNTCATGAYCCDDTTPPTDDRPFFFQLLLPSAWLNPDVMMSAIAFPRGENFA